MLKDIIKIISKLDEEKSKSDAYIFLESINYDSARTLNEDINIDFFKPIDLDTLIEEIEYFNFQVSSNTLQQIFTLAPQQTGGRFV